MDEAREAALGEVLRFCALLDAGQAAAVWEWLVVPEGKALPTGRWAVWCDVLGVRTVAQVVAGRCAEKAIR